MRARAAAVVAFVLLLGACSGGSPSGSAGTAAAATSASAVPAAAAAAGTSATRSGGAPCGTRRSATYRHVIWIWMENRTYSSVLGSPSAAPNLSAYAAKCGVATGYYGVTHPSLPNYLAATSGSTGGVTSDCQPTECPQGRASLFGQVKAAGRQWRGYAESMPSACALGISGRYAPKHNPAVYYTRIRSQCRHWDVPMGGSSGRFAAALKNRTLPAFSFVTPDMCSDGHDCTTSHADSWIGSWLGRITTSPAYRAGDTVVFLTWDEGVGSDQHIATVVLAPTVPKGARVSTRYNHYSLLRTTEELLHLRLLGAAASARSMRGPFRI